MSPRRIEPGPGQESVWDYPRPPRVEPTAEHVLIEHAGRRVAAERARVVHLQALAAGRLGLNASGQSSLMTKSRAIPKL